MKKDSRLHRWSRRTLKTLAWIAALEVGLRIVFPDMPNTRSTLAELAYEYNPHYIVDLKPNIVKTYEIEAVEGGGTVTWRTNSLGFRGGEIGPKKGLRIIVYGDSNTQARFSEAEKTYPRVLERILQKDIPQAQVINAGLVGAGPDENLLRMEEQFDSVTPDIVVFQVFADNDYGDIIRNRLFQLSDDGTIERTAFPVSVDSKFTKREDAFQKWVHKSYIQRALNQVVECSIPYARRLLGNNLLTKFNLRNLARRSKNEFAVYAANQPRAYSHFGDHYDIDIAENPDSASARAKIGLMDQVLMKAAQFCETKHALFIVLIEPSILDLTRNVGYGGYEDLARKFEHYKPTNLTDPLCAICTKYGITSVPLTDIYRANDADTVYRRDGHWNDKGQLLAAEETAKIILRSRSAH